MENKMELEQITNNNEKGVVVKKGASGFGKLYHAAKGLAVAGAILVSFAYGMHVGAQNPNAVKNIEKNAYELKKTIEGHAPVLEGMIQDLPSQEGHDQNQYGGK